MINRTANVRNSAPLTPLAALFAAVEAATHASDRAHDGGNEDRTAALLAHRTLIVAKITGGAAEVGAL